MCSLMLCIIIYTAIKLENISHTSGYRYVGRYLQLVPTVLYMAFSLSLLHLVPC